MEERKSLFVPPSQITDEASIGKAIIDEMGVGIGPDYVLYDEDTGAPVQFQGKNIKFSANNPELVYIGAGDVLFDPVHNLRMVTTMMGMYLDKEEGNGKEAQCMYDDNNREDRTTSHTIKFSNGESVTSKFYKNRCLAICDNFLEMANMNSDLSEFDDKEE